MNIETTGFVPGKGSAHDYIPAWMKLPKLYVTEKSDDPLAIIKLFTPDSSWTWFLTEFDGENLAFGLVVGLETEIGYISLEELKSARGHLGLHIERDLWFEPTPITQLPEYIQKWGTKGPYKGSQPVDKPQASILPEGWTEADIRFLLDQLDSGPLLVGDTQLGIPTIHDWPEAEHLGFGLFRVLLGEATLHFDGGGAMSRTPSEKGWCRLQIEGDFAYPFEEVRATLSKYLDTEQPQQQLPEVLLQDEAQKILDEAISKENNPAQTLTTGILATMDRVQKAAILSEPKDGWSPTPEELKELQAVAADLLQGDLSRGGDGYLALLTVARPGTLRLALEKVGEDEPRRRILKKRLRELEKG